MKTLVIIHNEDGRPCAWGLSADAEAALQEAERQWSIYVDANPEQIAARGWTRRVEIDETKPLNGGHS